MANGEEFGLRVNSGDHSLAAGERLDIDMHGRILPGSSVTSIDQIPGQRTTRADMVDVIDGSFDRPEGR